ncbi:hypothetical protein ACTWPB_27135 [Nocardia sp. IBHARD005]|uniref:hypothetical protein n=1 Tax=Nocardia sp. IBHARD005 TaxID=3457765 RepID=UPI004059879B
MASHRKHRGQHRPHRTTRELTVRSGADLRRRYAAIPTTRCAGGKRRYFNRGDAELVLANLGPQRQEKRSYECPGCHGWHLTSQTLDEYRRSQLEPRPASLRFAGIPASGQVPSPAELAARSAARRSTAVLPPHPAGRSYSDHGERRRARAYAVVRWALRALRGR